MADSKELAKLLAKHFIARPDVKAKQSRFGTYAPVHSKFTMPELVDHIEGKSSWGHYMIDQDDNVKLFALDIDLLEFRDQQPDVVYFLPTTRDSYGEFGGWQQCSPRQVWMSREQGPKRDFMKLQMRFLAQQFAAAVQKELDIKSIAAYSGSKGVHVYGLTGKISAGMAREGALLVLESLNWELTRGKNIFTYAGSDSPWEAPGNNFHQFNIEIYPKQDSIADKEKNLGNLMRLPLGKNFKAMKDQAFFMDLREPFTVMKPMDPYEALTTTDIWAYPHER